jgi:tetratricopeptide (TPR) repeat protein
MVLLGEEMERLMARGVRANPFAEGMWLFVRTGLANWQGRFEDELEPLIAARRAAEEQGHEQARFMFGFHEMLSYVGKGDYRAALSLLGEVIATCERIGEKVWLARYFNVVGWICGELQDIERAMDWNRRSLAAALELNAPDPEIESNARLNLGDNLLALGELAAAEEQFRTVERTVRNPRPAELWALWLYSQHLFHSYGELWLAKGDPEKALAYAAECLERAQATGRRKNVVKARRLQGQALLTQGRMAAAEEELTTALEVAQQIGNPPQLWKSWAALGDLRRAQGDAEQACGAYREALTVIDGVAAGLTDEQLRQTFLASAEVQRIRDAAHVGHP